MCNIVIDSLKIDNIKHNKNRVFKKWYHASMGVGIVAFSVYLVLSNRSESWNRQYHYNQNRYIIFPYNVTIGSWIVWGDSLNPGIFACDLLPTLKAAAYISFCSVVFCYLLHKAKAVNYIQKLYLKDKTKL